MDSTVPKSLVTELAQILSHLTVGDNKIRSDAERAFDNGLAQTPELYVLALMQLAISENSEVMRSLSLVLLRRILFRLLRPKAIFNPNAQSQATQSVTLHGQLSDDTLDTLEGLLLHCLLHEPSPTVRHKSIDTIAQFATYNIRRGRPWHALQLQAFSMTQSAHAPERVAAFMLFTESPKLAMQLETEAIITALTNGMKKAQTVDVQFSAFQASVAYIVAADHDHFSDAFKLVQPLLVKVTSPPISHFPKFISALSPLAEKYPPIFQPALAALLPFLSALILLKEERASTPTNAQPKSTHTRADEDLKEELRKTALEFMLTLCEGKPVMIKKVDGWAAAIVKGCLEGMCELDDDDLELWLQSDPNDDPTEDSNAHLYEQSLGRLASALGGEAVLPPTFQFIPSMLAAHDWRPRHAGLMAIAAIIQGTFEVMQSQLGKIIELIAPMFSDPHPRIRYAASQCVGQLCTYIEGPLQEQYGEILLAVLISTLEAPEPRVVSHAAAALAKFCGGFDRKQRLPHLDPIVNKLFELLHPSNDVENPVRRYVQEQAVMTLGAVAMASKTDFNKFYSSIMPLLLDGLKHANGELKLKLMETIGQIAVAVHPEIFHPDVHILVELLIQIQNGPNHSGDPMLNQAIIETWWSICQATGHGFEPYLPVVMPLIINAASLKDDTTVYDEDDQIEQEDGWEVIKLNGQTVCIPLSVMEEKCKAFSTLHTLCQLFGPKLAPYLVQSLEVALPSLRCFFHGAVHVVSTLLIPKLLACSKAGGVLTTQMVSTTFHELIDCIDSSPHPSYVKPLYTCFMETLEVIGGPEVLPQEYHNAVVEVTKRQIQAVTERREDRAKYQNMDFAEQFTILEEIDESVMESITVLLRYLDANHPLLAFI